MKSLAIRAWFALVALVAVMGLLLFVGAGTADYCGASAWTTLLLRRDPVLLERRMRGGPAAEKRPVEQLIMVCTGMLPFLIWRLFDEEKLLAQELPGYADYQTRRCGIVSFPDCGNANRSGCVLVSRTDGFRVH